LKRQFFSQRFQDQRYHKNFTNINKNFTKFFFSSAIFMSSCVQIEIVLDDQAQF